MDATRHVREGRQISGPSAGSVAGWLAHTQEQVVDWVQEFPHRSLSLWQTASCVAVWNQVPTSSSRDNRTIICLIFLT